jgi:hypothetical protein
LLLVLPAGCNDSSSARPTSASPPSPPTIQSFVVSGTVSETVDGISRPLPGHKVDIYISGSASTLAGGCFSGQPGCIPEKAEVAETDQNGRYTVQMTVFPKTRVFVAGTGLHGSGQQPCVASALVEKDTTIDVELFPLDRYLTPSPVDGPMITGVVYETTPQGRNPLRGVWAGLDVGFGDSWPVARIQTDDAGRFFFCRVNTPVRMAVRSYDDWLRDLPGTGDMFFEIELKR